MTTGTVFPWMGAGSEPEALKRTALKRRALKRTGKKKTPKRSNSVKVGATQPPRTAVPVGNVQGMQNDPAAPATPRSSGLMARLEQAAHKHQRNPRASKQKL